MSNRSRVIEQLGQHSLIEVVPGLEKLINDKGQIRVIDKGVELVKEGQPVKYLLIPVSHGLRLLQNQGRAKTPLGYLQKQRALALRQMLIGEPYAYSAVTEAATSVLIVPGADFLALVAAKPLVQRYLELMSSAASVRHFKRFLSERGVRSEDIVEVLGTFPAAVSSLVTDTKIPAGHLCFVESGRLRIDSDNATERATSYVGDGDFFGGEALVSPFTWSYSARTVEKSALRLVRAADLKDILGSAGMLDALYDEPCLWARGDESTQVQAPAPLASLPGEVVEPEGLRFDARDLQRCYSDSESFAASASNILLFVGLQSSPANLQTELAMAGRTSWLRIAELLEPMGAVCHAASRKLLTQASLPALTVLRGRAVVLLQVEKGRILYHDPARGFARAALEQWPGVSGDWDGLMLEVGRADHRSPSAEPDEDEGKRSPRERVLELVLRIVGENTKMLLAVFGLSLLGVGLSMIAPFFTQLILDNVLSLRDMRVLWGCAGGILLVAVLSSASSYAESRLVTEFSADFERKLSVALYRKGLALPLSAFRKHKSGDMLSRLGELGVIQHFLSLGSMQAVLSFITVIMSAVLLTFFSGKAALLAAVIALFTMGLQYLFRRSLRRLFNQSFDAAREGTSVLAEQIDAIGTVKASVAENAMMRRWETAYVRGLRLSYRTGMVQISSNAIIYTLSSLARLGGLWLAAQEALNGSLSSGQVFAVSLYLNQLVGSLLAVGSFLAQSERVLVALDKVGEIIANPEDKSEEAASSKMSVSLKGKIRFDKVSFRYADDGDWVLRDLSFSVYPQQIVAIVGRSGCGKTTLAQLLAGQLKPTSGRIYLDNYDSSFLAPSTLSKQIGFVMQSNQLFQSSLGDNLTYTDDAPDAERAQEAAGQAAALEFIFDNPAGMDRYLGEGGLGLSGGQKQRLSLARTLYRNPRIMILDEATSALDSASERAIVDNMREILRGRTSIVIAHRLSTIRHADLILVMQDGKIVEQGVHAALLQSGGHYAELFAGQVQGEAA